MEQIEQIEEIEKKARPGKKGKGLCLKKVLVGKKALPLRSKKFLWVLEFPDLWVLEMECVGSVSIAEAR